MINLLSAEQKKEILEEEKLKFILILGVVILAFFLSLFLILFSIKTSLSGDLSVQKTYLEQKEKELKIDQIKELEEEIKNLNLTLAKLGSFYQGRINFTEVLEKISKTIPEGVHLTSLSFNPSILQISLFGFSPDRDTLLKLKENLEEEGMFEKVYFPPANWIQTAEINFSVNLLIKPR